MPYDKTYVARPYGTITTGPRKGAELKGEDHPLFYLDLQEALSWCRDRKAKFVPQGRVELWERVFNEDESGFVYAKVEEV